MDQPIRLDKFVSKLPKGLILKIGSGSGYFYAYYNNELTVKRIAKESQKTKNYYAKGISAFEIRINNMPNKHKRELNELIKHSRVGSKAYQKKLAKLKAKQEKEKLYLNNTIENYKNLFNTFVPYQDRYVKRTWESDRLFEPNTLCIEVAGKEKGDYSLIDEYAYKNKVFIREEDKHFPQERLYRVQLKW